MQYRGYTLTEVKHEDPKVQAEINAFALHLVNAARGYNYCDRAAEVWNDAAREHNRNGSFTSRAEARAKNFAAHKGIDPADASYDVLVAAIVEGYLATPEILATPDPYKPAPTPPPAPAAKKTAAAKATPAKAAPRKRTAAAPRTSY